MNFVTNIFSGGEVSQGNQLPPGTAISELKHRTGILVLGDDSVVIGCHVENYRTGIEVRGRDALVRNWVCKNNHDILGTGVGLANTCDTYDWSDLGFERCAYMCNGSAGKPGEATGVVECPACPSVECPECPVCDSEEEDASGEETPDSTEARVRCPDGSTAESLAACPTACPRGEVECDDGRCVGEEWQCDPYVCPDGTEVKSARDCPEACPRGGVECDDGRCVEEEWQCDPYVCPDGTEVKNVEECPQRCEGFECEDGSCVREASECEVCCKVVGSSLTALTISYEKLSQSACAEKGEPVEDSYCKTGCAPGLVKCSDGSCQTVCPVFLPTSPTKMKGR